jgi:hypothetical protein
VNVKEEGGKKVRRNRLQALVEIRKLLHSTLKLDRILEIRTMHIVSFTKETIFQLAVIT